MDDVQSNLHESEHLSSINNDEEIYENQESQLHKQVASIQQRPRTAFEQDEHAENTQISSPKILPEKSSTNSEALEESLKTMPNESQRNDLPEIDLKESANNLDSDTNDIPETVSLPREQTLSRFTSRGRLRSNSYNIQTEEGRTTRR